MFRKTVEQDIDQIMEIIKHAQEYFKNNGIDQWQNNYPNAESIRSDISNGYSHVLLKDGQIIGTAAISFDREKNYDEIYDGKWLSHQDYAVIHRLAVARDAKGSGISSAIIKNVERMCFERGINSIKVDTHEANKPMQRLLEKNDFLYCGVILLEDGNKRIAFEKLL